MEKVTPTCSQMLTSPGAERPGAQQRMRCEHTSFPILPSSKRQECVSNSTTEAEVVAADAAFRTARLPAIRIWKRCTGTERMLYFHQYDKAVLDVVRTGSNPRLRCLSRTHGVNVQWLHEIYRCAMASEPNIR